MFLFRETIHQTSSKLTVEAKPHWGLISGFLFIPTIFGVIWLRAITADRGVITLACQKNKPTEVTCNRSASNFFGFVEQSETLLGTVSRAQLTSITRTNREGDDYTVDFTTLTTSIGLFNVFEGDSTKMQNYVAKINAFIASNESSFIVTQDTRKETIAEDIVFILLYFTFFVLPIIAVLKGSFRIETRTLDKNHQRLISRSKGLFKTQEESYPFENISRVKIQETTDSDGDKWYDTLVVVEGGQSTPKSLPLKANISQDIEKEKKFAEQVRNFLQLETPIEIVEERQKL